jgi:hypothetical protein
MGTGRLTRSTRETEILKKEGSEFFLFRHSARNSNCHKKAKQIRQRQKEDDGLFWADIDEAGALAVGTYTAGFFWQ